MRGSFCTRHFLAIKKTRFLYKTNLMKAAAWLCIHSILSTGCLGLGHGFFNGKRKPRISECMHEALGSKTFSFPLSHSCICFSSWSATVAPNCIALHFYAHTLIWVSPYTICKISSYYTFRTLILFIHTLYLHLIS